MMWKIAWICLAISILRLDVRGEKSSRVINVKSGSDIVLQCNVATNKNVELINWRINNSKTDFFVKFMNFKPFISEHFAGRLHVVNDSTILISRVSKKDSGIYRCRTMMPSTSGGAGVFQQGKPIKLNVQVQHPFFHKLPPERVVSFEDASITLECLVGGIPKPRIEWFRLDNELPQRTMISTSGGLTINRAETSDTGRYMCSATNVVGAINFEFDIEVKRNPQVIPSNRKTTTEGFPAVLDCAIDSGISTTNARFIWSKDGTNISPSNTGVSVLLGGKLYIKNCNRKDSGVYKCIAKTLDPTGTSIISHPGLSVFLDVQFPPDILLIEDVASAAVGSDARLSCVSKANPGTISTTWSRDGRKLTKPKYEVLQEGTLLIRSIRTRDAGTYTCTPSNSIGKGKSQSTRLVITVVPRFTQVSPSVETVRVGKAISLYCKAVSDKGFPVQLTWVRVNGPLPSGRAKVDSGQLTITDIQRDDYGEYVCLASTKEGTAKHSTTVTVISTPGAPNITRIERSGKTATVTWIPGYDGGHVQTFELWYRKESDTDIHWKFTRQLPTGTTSYKLRDVEPGEVYRFAVRGINREGAGQFSTPARREKDRTRPILFLPEKPLPPTNVIVNITADGYYVSWDHDQVPGRPLVKSFVLEYRKKNTSAAWTRADEMVNGGRRVYLLRADLFETESDYEFRVYAYAKKFSEPAYASKTYVIAPPVVDQPKSTTNVIPIVAGVLGTVALIFLLCLVCFCFAQYNSKKPEDKTLKKVHFLLPDSKSQAQEGDLDVDFHDEDVKLRPERVRFVPDDSDGTSNGKHWRRKVTKEDDFFLLSSCDHVFGGNMLNYETGPTEITLESTVTSPKDKVKFFEDVEQNGWFNCTLARPASNEVRDSYDQFCRTPSDIGSRDSLDHVAQKRALYEHKGSRIHLVKKFDSNSSLQFDKGKALRGPRYKRNINETLPPKPDVPLGQSKIHPHHWSSPAVYTNLGDAKGTQASRDSDLDSLGSIGRRRRRMNRPSSCYEGSVSLQPELNPITEQDSDTNLMCSCDSEHQDQESNKTNGLGEGSESSYLHLERTDTLKKLHTDQLNSWDEDSEGSVGKPYGPHPKEHEVPLKAIESDSENSISPAHSLVSLTDSDVDGEIARNIEKDTVESKRLSFSGEPDRSHLFRAVSYMKSMDAESSSDLSDKDDATRKLYQHEPHLTINEIASTVTNLNAASYSDSLDQLKACDPFYKNKPVTRTPSNASSGVSSAQVSSGETNSIDSLSVFRRHSKPGSTRSSATSSGFDTSSARESLASETGPTIYWSEFGKPYSSRSLQRQRFPHLEEPYEWDREGTGSELESGSETGGFSFKPNMIANMRHLLDLQRKLGIDLESSASSTESLADKKMDNIIEPESVNFEPERPSKYHVDNYSVEEKDKRCSRLMDEFKANKRVLDEKLNGSIIYQSWDV